MEIFTFTPASGCANTALNNHPWNSLNYAWISFKASCKLNLEITLVTPTIHPRIQRPLQWPWDPNTTPTTSQQLNLYRNHWKTSRIPKTYSGFPGKRLWDPWTIEIQLQKNIGKPLRILWTPENLQDSFTGWWIVTKTSPKSRRISFTWNYIRKEAMMSYQKWLPGFPLRISGSL